MNEEYNKAFDNDEVSKDEETADGFYDDSDFAFEEVEPQSVIIPDTVENKEPKAARGIKLFCAVLTVIFIAGCCVFIGYYIGLNDIGSCVIGAIIIFVVEYGLYYWFYEEWAGIDIFHNDMKHC